LRALSRSKLVNYKPYQLVTLSPTGSQAAKRIMRRHRSLREFFVNVLGVDETVADANACRIEHAVGDGVMRRLACFVEFLAASTIPARDVPLAFAAKCGQGGSNSACAKCKVARADAKAGDEHKNGQDAG